jgi:hypothetical protein
MRMIIEGEWVEIRGFQRRRGVLERIEGKSKFSVRFLGHLSDDKRVLSKELMLTKIRG